MHDVYDGGHETVTIKDAAERLRISEQAVRQRIRRKTLPAQRLDGKLYVVLSGGSDDSPPSPNGVHHGEHDTVASAVRNAYTELNTQLRSENELLRQQLTVKDDQIRANQVIVSQMAERLRALPAALSPEPEKNDSAPEVSQVNPARLWWQFWKW